MSENHGRQAEVGLAPGARNMMYKKVKIRHSLVPCKIMNMKAEVQTLGRWTAWGDRTMFSDGR
jgi:hypothetical protein